MPGSLAGLRKAHRLLGCLNAYLPRFCALLGHRSLDVLVLEVVSPVWYSPFPSRLRLLGVQAGERDGRWLVLVVELRGVGRGQDI